MNGGCDRRRPREANTPLYPITQQNYDSHLNGVSGNAIHLKNILTKHAPSPIILYDGDGRQAWHQGTSGIRVYYVYDGDNPVLSPSGSGGSTLNVLTFGANGLLSERITGADSFFTFDPSGNTCQRLSSTQAVQYSHLTTAFGTQLVSGSSEDYDGFGAQWGYRHVSGSVFLLGHRFYNAAKGQFLTRDPIGYRGGVNLYGYTGNNPTNWADSSGLSPFWDWVDTGWASFDTLIGVIGGLGGTASYDYTNRVTVVQGGWVAGILQSGGWGAITFGEVIITPDCSTLMPIYNHELGQVDQSRILGPLYLLTYGVGWLVGIGRGDYHDANPLEVDADLRAGMPNRYNDPGFWGWGGADPNEPTHTGRPPTLYRLSY